MTMTILTRRDLDEVARACDAQDRRDCALGWRCIIGVAVFELIVGAIALSRWI